ncbi:MAG: RNA polymerase sigma-70 factor [Bacteroidota bacterium]
MKNLTDSELLVKSEREEKAFRVLFDRYWFRLYQYSYNILGDPAVCEDLIQDVFVDLWQKKDKSAIKNLSAYLFQSVKFQIFKSMRNGKTAQKHLDRIQQIGSYNSIEDQLNATETAGQIKKLINQLPKRCRQIFVLSRYEYLSNQEIAEQLGISVQTVKNQISKALAHLREHIDVMFIFFL